MFKKLLLAFLMLSNVNLYALDKEKEGLLCYFDFEEIKDDIAKDKSGKNNDGKIHRTNINNGIIGNALKFDGNSYDYLEIPSIKEEMDSFTIEFWIYPFSTDGNQVIEAGNNWNAFCFHTDKDGGIYVGTDLKTRFTPSEIGSGIMEVNRWQHFVYVYDNGTGRFYKNSMLLAEKQQTKPIKWNSFRIGCNNSATVNGIIDEFRIYNRALDSKEIGESSKKGMLSKEFNKKAVIKSVIKFDFPDTNYRYFVKGSKLPSKVSMTGIPGKYLAKFQILDTNEKIVYEDRKEIIVKDEKEVSVESIILLYKCGIYQLTIILENEQGKKIKTQEFLFGIVVELFDASKISADSPLGIHCLWAIPEHKLLGAKWDRSWNGENLMWYNIEKTQGKYDWQELDKYVEEKLKSGVEILYTIHGTPDWASQQSGQLPSGFGPGCASYPPKDMKYLEMFVKELVTRYKGKIRYWDFWNEPNSPHLLLIDSDNMVGKVKESEAKEYVEMLKVCYKAIKEVDPDSKVLGFNGYNAKTIWPENCLKLGAGEYFDILGYHNYNSDNPNIWVKKKLLQQLNDLMVKYTGKTKPLWNTEIGFVSAPRKNSTAMPMTEKEYMERYKNELQGEEKDIRISRGPIMLPEHRLACWNMQSFLMVHMMQLCI